MNRKILCLDFDGVLHSYSSGWCGANNIPDPPVAGAIDFLYEAVQSFDVQIFSSRSHQEGGIAAMQDWLQGACNERYLLPEDKPDLDLAEGFAKTCAIMTGVKWPTEKPPAHVSLDDRAITFTGQWPNIEGLVKFKPWNRT